MSDRDDFGAFLIGFVVGGITGAITALLFAPQAGEETRTMIRDKAIELRDQTSETVGESLAKAEKAAKDAVKQAEKLLDEAKKRASDFSIGNSRKRGCVGRGYLRADCAGRRAL